MRLASSASPDLTGMSARTGAAAVSDAIFARARGEGATRWPEPNGAGGRSRVCGDDF